MEITYDSKADVLNITFKKVKAAKTVEIAPEINLDLDKKGRPLSLEIIGASEKIGKKRVNEILMRNLLFPLVLKTIRFLDLTKIQI